MNSKDAMKKIIIKMHAIGECPVCSGVVEYANLNTDPFAAPIDIFMCKHCGLLFGMITNVKNLDFIKNKLEEVIGDA